MQPTDYEKKENWSGGMLHDTKVPVVVGLLLMVMGLAGGILGAAALIAGSKEPDFTGGCMLLIGALFIFFTGLWFMTRSGVNERKVIGLIVMVVAVVGGTWGGLAILSSEGTQTVGPVVGEMGNVVFLCGLLMHLVAVLYVKNE